MITLRGRLPRFAPPLKQRCCRRRGLLRCGRTESARSVARYTHANERARERSNSQVNESNRIATSFSPLPPSLLLRTLWNLNLPVLLPFLHLLRRVGESIKHWSKNAGACVRGPPPTAGAGLQTTDWMEVVLADG